MPILQSEYEPPLFFKNCHLQTVFQTLFRPDPDVNYLRERIKTEDNDFIDIDWSRKKSQNLAIITHGMESSTNTKHIKGMVKTCNNYGWDCAAVNSRGCSGEPNTKLRSYHAGSIEDLHTVITHIIKKYSYLKIALIGFSLGGNLCLKYAGENGNSIQKKITCIAGISVPCDLEATAWKLSEPSNSFYMKRFLKKYHKKIIEKKCLFPDKINDRNFNKIKTFKDFDDRYTAPIHGFINAEDYWKNTNCKQFLTKIKTPSLIINAQDDPFLPIESFPVKEAKMKNPDASIRVSSFYNVAASRTNS